MNDPDAYCREIEAYLCRKNDGHLIRIVGPAFDMVRGWASQGIPVKVACAGIDRTFERYHRKGPRRRPLRAEFCDADVLDAFDGWRRAVGVHANEQGTGGGGQGAGAASPARRGSLVSHIERALAAITQLRARGALPAPLLDALASAADALDPLHADARTARGEARDAIVARLALLDDRLLEAARTATPDGVVAEMGAEAEAELVPFRSRMTPDAIARARAVAVARMIRAHQGLPQVRYE